MPPERRSLDNVCVRSRPALQGSGARGLQRDEATRAIVEAEADGMCVVGPGDSSALPVDVAVPAGPLETLEAHGR